MGLLSGLAGLGLDNLENADIFESKDADASKKEKEQEALLPTEEECIFDKHVDCPVCGRQATAKVVKSGKVRLIGTDLDLRPRYEGVDSSKYDVIRCDKCGFTALTRYFATLMPSQIKAIKEQISRNVSIRPSTGKIYTYQEALDRYRLALANAVVKKAKNSEKAYICLKTAWLIRGYLESGELNEHEEKKQEMQVMEMECLQNAFTGFVEARQSESFPMCGMDESTIDYLLGALAYEIKNYETAAKMVQAILVSATASKRAKDKALALKDLILEEKKKQQG